MIKTMNRYDLIEKISLIISDYTRYDTARNRLAKEMKPFLWENSVSRFESVLERLAEGEFQSIEFKSAYTGHI